MKIKDVKTNEENQSPEKKDNLAPLSNTDEFNEAEFLEKYGKTFENVEEKEVSNVDDLTETDETLYNEKDGSKLIKFIKGLYNSDDKLGYTKRFLARNVFTIDGGENSRPWEEVYQSMEHNNPNNFMPYDAFDRSENLVFIDKDDEIRVGFGFMITPLMIQAESTAKSLNSLISSLDVGSTLMSCVFSSPLVDYRLSQWEGARVGRDNELVRKMAERRRRFTVDGSILNSLTKGETYHSKENYYMIFVTIPFTGDTSDAAEISEFMSRVSEEQKSTEAILDSTSVSPVQMNYDDYHYILWHLTNPNRMYNNPLAYRERYSNNSKKDLKNILSKDSVIKVTSKGHLTFKGDDGGYKEPFLEETVVVPLTVDEYPNYLYPSATGSLMGVFEKKDSRIPNPFFLYTIVEIPDAKKVIKRVKFKNFVLNKQLVSDSAWAKNNLADMFNRRDDGDMFISFSKGANIPVRMYTGINLYTSKEKAAYDTRKVIKMFNEQDFTLTPDLHISFPIWLCSLPHFYNAKYEKPDTGLQRSNLVTSWNAACAMHLQGEWKGTDPSFNKEKLTGSGIVLTGAKGQIATLDIFQSPTNNNFVVVGTSGGGKSFLVADIVSDIFSRGGVVRVIDIGYSYYSLCEIMEGQNLVFDPENPISLNPFYAIKTEESFRSKSEFLTAIVVLMAFPDNKSSSSWEYKAIEGCISRAWKKKGYLTELQDVYEELLLLDLAEQKAHKELVASGVTHEFISRAGDIAFQLQKYALPSGAYYDWFAGPCTLELDNEFMVFEMEKVGVASAELRNIILSLVINLLETEMYLSDRSKLRLNFFDEAHQFIADAIVAVPLELFFRKARKYNGSVGLGTQSFADSELSVQSRACFENAGWTFVLKQSPASAVYAFKEGLIESTNILKEIIPSIKLNKQKGFAELLVKTPFGGDFLFRLITDKFTHFTYSSSDHGRIKLLAEKEDQSLSLKERTSKVIEAMADEATKDLNSYSKMEKIED